MVATIDVRRKRLRDEPGALFAFGAFVWAPGVGLSVVLGVEGFTTEFVAGSLVILGTVWPLWPGFVRRVMEQRRARLRVDEGGLTIVDWRGRERRLDRSAIRAVHRYAVDEGSEGGSSRHERDLVEIEGARPVWITLGMWDQDTYQQVWPALGMTTGDARPLRWWGEAPELNAEEANRQRMMPFLLLVGWVVGAIVLMGLGFYIASATDTSL